MPRKHYTHLLAPSAELIASYIKSMPGRYIDLDFDVKVGFGRDPGPEFDRPTRMTAIQLSQRRIDCVGFSADRIDIIEVTPKAGLTALGQMIAYPMLYDATFPQDLPIFAVLVTHEFAPDIQSIFDAIKIEYNIMPKPEPVPDNQNPDSGDSQDRR